MGRSFDENGDPLARIMAPPVNETTEERRARERQEANAKKISEQIDEALKAEREEGKAKRKNRLKILLLGQSESGTSIRLKGRRPPHTTGFASSFRSIGLFAAARISKFSGGYLATFHLLDHPGQRQGSRDRAWFPPWGLSPPPSPPPPYGFSCLLRKYSGRLTSRYRKKSTKLGLSNPGKDVPPRYPRGVRLPIRPSSRGRICILFCIQLNIFLMRG